ncbi:MAG: Beta-galactosidase, partial [Acidobacteria bacterium]|nr:Beta-galactosidase [Acidobacteriota bacterium]
MRFLLSCLLLTPFPVPAAGQGWWMTEPVRWVQTNLRETDAALDPGRHAGQLADMRANVVLMGMGGICAYYPTRVAFHYPSAYLPA